MGSWRRGGRQQNAAVSPAPAHVDWNNRIAPLEFILFAAR